MHDRLEHETTRASHAIVPGQCVRLTGETARVTIPGQCNSAGPSVELIRDGDVVRAIDVTCGCGQRIRLRCVY